MKRHTRLASGILAATLTTALSFGLTTPAEAAGHGKAQHSSAKPTRPVKAVKANQAAKRLEAARRTVVRELTVRDARLAKALRADHLTDLPVEIADVLVANRDADRAEVATWLAAAGAATTVEELAALRSSAKSVRPEVYAVALDAVETALALQAEVDAVAAAVDPLTIDPAVLELLDAATSAVQAVLDAAVAVSALDGHAAVGPVTEAIELAVAAVAELSTAVAPVDPVDPVI